MPVNRYAQTRFLRGLMAVQIGPKRPGVEEQDCMIESGIFPAEKARKNKTPDLLEVVSLGYHSYLL
jgi:hypothetical protein